MYYRVTLLNNSVDKSYADILLLSNGKCEVYSENAQLRTHLNTLLLNSGFIMSPVGSVPGKNVDGVARVIPGNMYYVQALPELLAWRGYNAKLVNETHKAFGIIDFSMKADAGDNIYYNDKGERIVKRVPLGMVAVSTDGRSVAGGRWLNANIDKEGAVWSLYDNPYESSSPEERQQAQQFMQMGFVSYNPGAYQELYDMRTGEDDSQDFYQNTEKMKGKGRTLETFFSEKQKPEASKEKSPTPMRKPQSIKGGKVLYSPELGIAMDSSFWPPEEGSDKDWYVFESESFTDEEKQDLIEDLGELLPGLVIGTEKGPVQTEKGLDVSGGYLLELPEEGQNINATPTTADIQVNTPRDFTLTYEALHSEKELYKRKQVHERLHGIKSLTAIEREDGTAGISPKLEDLDIEGLVGENAKWTANFKGREYQKAGVLALTEKSQYEIPGRHGVFLNWTYGSGKTGVVTAANTKMQNDGEFKVGTQTTIISAPNANVYVWSDEISKFTQGSHVVINGSREKRIQQWEDILAKARRGELDDYVVVGASAFRATYNGEGGVTDEETWEDSLDAQYMKLLAMGGTSQGAEVKGGHVAALTIDESGMYGNPKTTKYRVMADVVSHVASGGGKTWLLSGDISGNSPLDTISQLSLVNDFVRKNYDSVAKKYITKAGKVDATLAGAARERPVWKPNEGTKRFAAEYGDQVYSLSGKTIGGDEYGLSFTEDMETPLGKVWGGIYAQAYGKYVAELKKRDKTGNMAFGLMSIMVNASYGAVNPARLIEYGVGVSNLSEGVWKSLGRDRGAMQEFTEQLSRYKELTQQSISEVGEAADARLSIKERNDLFDDIFSDRSKEAMRRTMNNWACPAIDGILDGIDKELANKTGDRNVKMGIAGFSKVALRAMYDRLLDKYGTDNFQINIIDGDTKKEEVAAIQKRHQNEKDKHVVTLVTTAGMYGLSLPADRTWRFAMWNPATGEQAGARFHRHMTQKNLTTVVVPSGIGAYMRFMEKSKGSQREAMTNALMSDFLDASTDGDELTITGSSGLRAFSKKLEQFPIRIDESRS